MSNTPKIRFSGFTEDWEQRKVTDLGEIYIGLVTTMTEHYTDKGHLLIRNSDIKDGYFEFGENPIYLDEEFSEQNKSRMHQLGDVITVHTGDIGTSAVIGENEVNSIGFATIVTRPNQEILDSNYFATYLNTDTHKQWAISMATGDGRSNYNLKDYTKLVVPIPEIEEQKKIATCIVNLNSLITLHQRKCDETKRLKKYMLQKMFPQNGEKVPEIRFSGFTDDWEQRKLGDVVEDYVEKTTVEDQYPVLTSSQRKGIVLQDDFFAGDRVNQNGNIGYFIIPRGYFAFRSRSDNDVFVFNRNDAVDMGIISYFYPVFKPRGVDSDFLLRRLNYGLEDQIKINSEGTGQHVLSLKKFKNMIGLFPSYEEQKKIGSYFSQIDHLITLHQRELENLQNIKKFMLGKMFV